jgi:methionyl aminopeptidase
MSGNSTFKKSTVELKTKAEMALMRNAGLLAGQTLKEIEKHVAVGVSTKELDVIAEKFIRSGGGIPTFIGYRGYPATICASINEEVVHGIPGNRRLKNGDVVSIDVAATVDGFVGDTATTFIVGEADARAKKLVQATKESLEAGIQAMKIGQRLGDVGAAVQKVAESNGFGVVKDFVGHGIGRRMHEEPAVPNYGTAGQGLRLEPGLVIAIEPMITMGDWQVKVLKDGWTVVTLDGSLAAHFEHTIALTEDGPVVLTKVD